MAYESGRNDKQTVIREGLNRWALYFRRKINEELVNIYRKYMAPYSVKTLHTVIEQVIENADRFPKVYEIKYQLAQVETLEDIIIYDAVEDLRYPVGKLWNGYWILVKSGKKAFVSYADNVRMPSTDRERVFNKARAAWGDTPATLAIINGVAESSHAGDHERGFHEHPGHQAETER